jgi:lysophospholipase L1-like esterase
MPNCDRQLKEDSTVRPEPVRRDWRRRRVLLSSALLLSGLCSVGVRAQTVFQSTQPAPRVEYWQQRQAAIDKALRSDQDLTKVKLAFLGDSITDFWLLAQSPWHTNVRYGRALWEESFGAAAGPNRALNLGISGDRLEHVLHRIRPRSAGGLGHLDGAGLAPEFVVLLIGINNSWMSEEPVVDSIVEGTRAVLEAVHARQPQARIVLQTLLPTAERDRNEQIVQPVNRRLAGLAASPRFAGHVSLLDLHAAFLDREGRQVTSYFVDGLHPNEAGYRAWRDRLVPFLASLREDERQRRKP